MTHCTATLPSAEPAFGVAITVAMKANRAGPHGSLPTSRHFEDRLEDVSYFLSYNYPIRVGMAHHEGRTVRLAMGLRITCRMDRSDLHHLRGYE